jgi:hypothetical protein
MPDEKLPLILSPGSGLALVRPQGGRIVREMVDGALASARRQDFSVSDEKLTPELWFQRGEAHYYGRMVIQSFEEAARCYKIATEHGHLDAACNLGCLLTVGLGVSKDPARAARLFENAAGHGHPVGSLNLSYLYEFGIGLTTDKLKARFYHYLGEHKNDPSRWRFNPSRMVPGAGVTLTDDMVGYDYSFQFEPKRTDKFITFYEVLLPTMETLVSEENIDAVLRKVRSVEIPCSGINGDILVIDSGDGPLTCGDLLERDLFETFGLFITNEGGRPPQGIVYKANPDGFLYDKESAEMIARILQDGRIELETSHHSREQKSRIIASFYKRGLGVRQNDVEAARWHVDFSRKIMVGSHEFYDPDYQQILLWAKALRMEPNEVLVRLLTDPVEELKQHKTLIKDGRIVQLYWMMDLLPLEHFEWVDGLVIESIYFVVSEEPTNSLGTLVLPLPQLQSLFCTSLGLTRLDLSMVPLLTELNCNANQLTELDLSAVPELSFLDCCANQLTELDLSAVPELRLLWCSANQLTELDFTRVPQLKGLGCSANQLTKLDLSAVPQILILKCSHNQITELDLSTVPLLTHLHCPANQISALDIRPLKNLKTLQCDRHLARLIERPDQNF